MALRASDLRGLRGPVAAVVVDIPAQDGYLTIATFADDTTSLYTSHGGATVGAGNYRPVAEATRNLLQTAASHVQHFAEPDPGGWPSAGTVRFHLVLPDGNRYLDLPERVFWGQEDHQLKPFVDAAQGVVSGIRLVQDAQSSPHPGNVPRLMGSAQQGDVDEVQKLLDYGARVDAQDDAGYTALMYAASAGSADVVRVLLEHGADPDARDKQSSTPLMFAAQGGHVEIVRALIQVGTNLHVRGAHGLTALGFAQQNGHAEAVAVLLQAGGPE